MVRRRTKAFILDFLGILVETGFKTRLVRGFGRISGTGRGGGGFLVDRGEVAGEERGDWERDDKAGEERESESEGDGGPSGRKEGTAL